MTTLVLIYRLVWHNLEEVRVTACDLLLRVEHILLGQLIDSPDDLRVDKLASVLHSHHHFANVLVLLSVQEVSFIDNYSLLGPLSKRLGDFNLSLGKGVHSICLEAN